MRRLCLALILALITLGCGPEPGTPEEQIRDLIDGLEAGAEAGEIDPFQAALAASFRSDSGLDRDDVLNRIRLYLLQHQRLHLITRVESIDVAGADLASATVLLGTAARPIDSAEVLTGYRAGVYRIGVELERAGGQWRAHYARWERVSATALIQLM
ncbi:hypothetical protein H0Z60_07145 [Ectothiorhodospiraceae bacterium WFHF3C12]|nr:hypothetical protein [Ectothiorhodospiraceae bacterium WFHF3C12]